MNKKRTTSENQTNVDLFSNYLQANYNTTTNQYIIKYCFNKCEFNKNSFSELLEHLKVVHGAMEYTIIEFKKLIFEFIEKSSFIQVKDLKLAQYFFFDLSLNVTLSLEELSNYGPVNLRGSN